MRVTVIACSNSTSALVDAAAERRGAGGLGRAGERDVPLAGEQARRRIEADPAGAREVDLAPGTNVKMVATHCGLSVGEDGPTHQAIDDMGSFLGMFHTAVIEPADPNHCDRIIRFAAGHFGNFYVRMGRHKIPVLTREDGSIFYDEKYRYKYGKCDVFREGHDITVIASGPMVSEALKARDSLSKEDIFVEIIIVSSPKKFDAVLEKSIRKTKTVLTIEDHNPYSGFGGQVAKFILEKGIEVEGFETMGVEVYQLSGKPEELYATAKISSKFIILKARELCSKL